LIYNADPYQLKLNLNPISMRKILTSVTAVLITGSLFAGGLVTNNNHSALFTRLQNRNASTSVDAVYFNPAGVTRLGDGFFASINNQTISQTQIVTTNYASIAGMPKEYIGKVSAPIFPAIYAAYNTGNFSFSAGFNPIGGGGGAEYADGLPSFESMVSDIPPSLTFRGIPTSQYDADIFFEGSSVYFGYQVNVGYKISDMISVAAGMRLVSAKNTYNGYLRNIRINPNYPAFGAGYTGGMVRADEFFSDGSDFMTTLATGANTAAAGLNAAISGGTPAGTPLTALPAQTVAAVTQLLGAAQISASGMTVGQAAAALEDDAAPLFTGMALDMAINSALTEDIEVDAEESGTGFTPILSVNIAPSENLNLALRYEFRTKMDLTTKVNGNLGGGLFEDGYEVPGDMPAMLAIGAEYKPMGNLMVAASFNTYFDQAVDYDGSKEDDIDMIDKNFLEYGLGAEYGLSERLRISAGWSATSTGVKNSYQSDMRFDINTNSFGGGIGYRITPMIDLNLGGQYTFYKEESIGTETFDKKTWLIGIGADFFFGK
jgi:long-subunit fatty acid transport protein